MDAVLNSGTQQHLIAHLLAKIENMFPDSSLDNQSEDDIPFAVMNDGNMRRGIGLN